MTVGGLVSGFHRLMMMRSWPNATTRMLHWRRSLERGGHSSRELVVVSSHYECEGNHHKHHPSRIPFVKLCLQPTTYWAHTNSLLRTRGRCVKPITNLDALSLRPPYAFMMSRSTWITAFLLVASNFIIVMFLPLRFQWPISLRRVPAATHLLGLRVRILPGTGMSVSCECCVLSGEDVSARTGHSSGRLLPFVLCHCVWYRNRKNGAALARVGLLHQSAKVDNSAPNLTVVDS